MTDRDRLIELLKKDNCPSPYLCDEKCKYANLKRCYEARTADYLLANGVIVPPCKVGDIVFTSYDHIFSMQTNEIFTCRVVFIGFGENGNYINIVDNYGHMHSMSFEEFDKTVFFTRKEAEKH